MPVTVSERYLLDAGIGPSICCPRMFLPGMRVSVALECPEHVCNYLIIDSQGHYCYRQSTVYRQVIRVDTQVSTKSFGLMFELLPWWSQVT